MLQAVRLGDSGFILRLMAWSEGLDRQADLGRLSLVKTQLNAAAWIESLAEAIELLRLNPDWNPENETLVASAAPAPVAVLRDQHNEAFRNFYLSLNLNDAMLATCDVCGILMTRDGGGMIGGIGGVAALQRNPNAVAAFLQLMAPFIGKERLPSLEGNPMLVGLGLLDPFTLKPIDGIAVSAPLALPPDDWVVS